MTRDRIRAESLRSVETFAALQDVSEAEWRGDYFPSFAEIFAEIFDRWGSNFASVAWPKAKHLENFTLEVILPPAEAQAGGTVRVNIPALATCPVCGGRGDVGPFECWRCNGRGAYMTDYPADLAYPAGLLDAHVLQLPLTRWGIGNFHLNVLFHASDEW